MTREMNNSVETVNAAATAIVTAESRVQQATIQKRRWGGCWSIYWCFGSHRHPKRIGHAVLAPEPNLPGPVGPDAPENQAHQPTVILPFIAPPSSPASFIQSEPPSATHSPAGLLSLTSLSASVYSPRGPRSIFAIGPYAHEKQLVSPPVFSTFTTEPSTAPFTPPPEPVHLTTPSSPEVPFAQLLTTQDSNHKSRGVCREFPTSQYEFQSYQLYPGSPVGHLISPNSAFSGSGTSSPFPDLEFPSNSYPFPPFGTTTAPNLLSIDSLSFRKSLPRQASSISATSDSIKSAGPENLLLEDQISALASIPSSNNGLHNDELVVNHRVSFELTVANCLGNELDSVHVATSELDSDPVAKDQILAKAQTSCDSFAAAPSDVLEEREARAGQPSVGTLKEFKFDNADGASAEPTVDSDWWANEKVVGTEPEARNNWAFFPMIQPGVS